MPGILGKNLGGTSETSEKRALQSDVIIIIIIIIIIFVYFPYVYIESIIKANHDQTNFKENRWQYKSK